MHKGLKIVGGSLLAAWLALNPGHALAQENKDEATSIPQPSTPKREAWMDASDYSVGNGVVTFAVYGHANDATNHQMTDFIEARFSKMGVSSVGFSGNEDEEGASFYFFIQGHGYGPVGLNEIVPTIDKVAHHAKSVLPGLNTDMQKKSSPVEMPSIK